MLALGVALDSAVYDRALAYQPGWLALPLGALELALVYTAMRTLGDRRRSARRSALYARRLGERRSSSATRSSRASGSSTREAGGELGRVGGSLHVAAVVARRSPGSAAPTRPPTDRAPARRRPGPLVIRHAQTLVGGIVRGGIVIRADHVTLRDVTVIGGENGIDVEHAEHVMLDHVRVLALDPRRHPRATRRVMVKDCTDLRPAGPWVQGIDISFSMDKRDEHGRALHDRPASAKGSSTHSAMVDVMHNHVIGTIAARHPHGRDVDGTRRATTTSTARRASGILCLDHSSATIKHNTISGAKVDAHRTRAQRRRDPGALLRQGAADHNTVIASPGGVQAFDNSTISR